MKNNLLLIILLIAILGAGFFILRSGSSSKNDQAQVQPQPISEEQAMVEESTEAMPAEEVMTATYTLDEVRAHDNKEDCWLVLHGKVYDVTGFDTKHPGKEAILQGCGLDATELFETRPMGSGTPHSETARGFLDNFYIGDLK